MNGRIKEVIHFGFILSLICAIAGASLAIAHSLAQPRILARARMELFNSLKEVMPASARFEEMGSEEDNGYYKAYDKEGKFIGIVFKASARGYSSVIEIVAGLTRSGQITTVKILDQNETPGIGTRITEPFFIGQFINRNIEEIKGVQAIARATISSKAVIDAVNQKAQVFKELIKDER